MYTIYGERMGHIEILEDNIVSEDAVEVIAFEYRMSLPDWTIWFEEH